MQKNLNDNDILKFFQGLKRKRTADQITRDYIHGYISRDEFFEQMKETINDKQS